MPDPAAPPRLKPCPICGKLALEQFRPFCSRRCADVDLHRWLAGVYAVPAVENEDGIEEAEAPESKTGLSPVAQSICQF